MQDVPGPKLANGLAVHPEFASFPDNNADQDFAEDREAFDLNMDARQVDVEEMNNNDELGEAENGVVMDLDDSSRQLDSTKAAHPADAGTDGGMSDLEHSERILYHLFKKIHRKRKLLFGHKYGYRYNRGYPYGRGYSSRYGYGFRFGFGTRYGPYGRGYYGGKYGY